MILRLIISFIFHSIINILIFFSLSFESHLLNSLQAPLQHLQPHLNLNPVNLQNKKGWQGPLWVLVVRVMMRRREEVTSEEGGDLEKEVDSYITFLVINEKKIKKESDLLW